MTAQQTTKRVGYKQTDVGIIPNEWDAKLLTDLCWFQEGPGIRQWQFTTSGMKVINVTNLENGVLNLERTDRHVTMSEFKRTYQHFAIDAGDIVVASSGNSYGKTAKVRQQDLPLMMNTSVIRFKPGKSTDYDFLWAFINSWIFKDQVNLMITGGAQPNFGPFHLKRILVPTPPIVEQRAIGGGLSDTDDLIGALDKLIAKKRDLKQAAMQQLLTGKRRLAGFRSEWKRKRIVEIAPLQRGFDLPTTSIKPGIFPVVYSNGVLNHHSECMVKGPGVVTGRSGTIGKVNYVDQDYWPHNTALWVTSFRHNDPKFIFYLYSFIGFERFSIGSGVPTLNRNDVHAIEVDVPSDPKEQTSIAAVLSDMDAEIAALADKRDKARDLKQGMMQELLTGKRRLI
jgi:type I restriction enzyme S subunit